MSDLETTFPLLRETSYAVTSPRDVGYNCIAWAAGSTDRWWWPDPQRLYFWPRGAPRRRTVQAFADAYSEFGYAPCDSSAYEIGCEKIAVFVDAEGSPTHAARQLLDGRWTSKIGKLEDIVHELHALEGQDYGRVALILRRQARP